MNPEELSPYPRWAPVVAASVVVHAAILAGALTLAPMSDRPRRFYAPAITVDLVGPGPGRAAASPPAGKAERPAPQVKAKVEPPPKAKVVEPEKPKAPEVKAKVEPPPKTAPKVAPAPKAKVEPERPKAEAPKPPPKKEEGGPPSEGAEVQAGLQEIRERLAKAQKGTGGPGGPRGGASSALMELRHRAYYNQIWQIFAEAWVLMESVRSEKLLAIVAIGIDGAGKIAKVQFERRSGDRFFDESVERALAKVGQLPPPPETESDGLLWVGLRFTPTGVQ